MQWRLNQHQLFNLDVLKNFIRNGNFFHHKNHDELIKEIVSHGWDIAVVEMAVEQIIKEK